MRTMATFVSLHTNPHRWLARGFRHLKNMQKSRINHNFRLISSSSTFFSSNRRLSSWLPAFLLMIGSLTVHAQITPSLPGGVTTQPGATQPGAVPSRGGTGTLQPGTTVNVPGRGPVTVPNNVNVPGNRTNGALNPNSQPNGRTGQPGVNQQIGRQVNGQVSQPGNGQPNQANEQFPDSLNPQPATTQEALEDGYEAARRREREETRQKLFGYSLFNDPNLATTFQPNLNIATPRNYVVGPGDQLNIQMYGYSETDFSQTVSPEGNVYFGQATGIGPVYVAGLTIEQAKARIVGRLSKRYVGLRSSSYGPANTFLEITLGNIRSIRVSVLGEAVRPGTYTLSSLSTVMNAIYQAGGPNELGSFRKVQLIRNNKAVATLDLYDYLLTGTQRNDLPLRDNDVIRFSTFVSRVEITGTVKRNNIFELLPEESLDRLLYYAGGFAANAYKGRIKVTRLTDRERKVIDVTADQFAQFDMQDGDLVTVEQLLDRFENQITIEGAVFRPGQYSLDQNKTLKQLIQSAEGLRGDAFVGRINIIRTREDLAIENITVNLSEILNGTQPDVPLQREDQIIITSKFDLAEQANISVQGEVNIPNEGIPYMANMTLNDALLRVGGLKESAAASQVEVVRRKKDVDPRSASAQIADIYRFNVNRDLSMNTDDNKFVLEPFDQIIVRRSPNYLIQTYARIEGEVIVPGEYPIRSKDQKVSDLIGLAGGLTPQAYPAGATLIRRIKLSADEVARRNQSVTDIADAAGNKAVVETDQLAPDQEESIGINLRKILEKPGSSEDILVQEGDLLRIPKLLETVRVQGEVLMPTTVKFRGGQTFQDYISQAGGFTSKSQRRKSFVVYANGSVDRTRKFMFFNIYPRVEPGSEVIVPKQTSTPLTPQQILSSTAGTISSLLSVIGLVIALSRVAN
ncbi:ligand-binding protein [Fibrisoma montanum]|uniref:Ligand-binding protein n=2 Tax=Fibrisoma montanum TaxID=2305895 RepID=A0A418M634_9BACT|nr:ligand-binding protein [Fibrisoma montanum]